MKPKKYQTEEERKEAERQLRLKRYREKYRPEQIRKHMEQRLMGPEELLALIDEREKTKNLNTRWKK